MLSPECNDYESRCGECELDKLSCECICHLIDPNWIAEIAERTYESVHKLL